jgi:putative hydrolase of the HAD superfamily
VNNPKMIIFDYGQTIIDEKIFDPLEGTRAVLNSAAINPNNVSADEVQALAYELGKDIGRWGVDAEEQTFLEVHNHVFQNYLYEYFDIEFTKPMAEIERIFQSAACIAEPTKNIVEFLKFLASRNIRTSVVSNISFSGNLLKEHINNIIPSNNFEFIIASSEYIFRKPHKRIFELALRKAKLNASDAWYCGDNAVFDVDGAAASGIFPVWYKGAIQKSNNYIPKSHHLEVNNWNELINMLEKKKF